MVLNIYVAMKKPPKPPNPTDASTTAEHVEFEKRGRSNDLCLLLIKNTVAFQAV